MESLQKETLPSQTQEFFDDRTVDIEQRIDLARLLAEKHGELSVLLAINGVADDIAFNDRLMSGDDIRVFSVEFGFPENAYEIINRYEWRTRSTIHPDLTLQIKEGPIQIGAPTELFPNGQAWSQHDYVNTLRVLVAPLT